MTRPGLADRADSSRLELWLLAVTLAVVLVPFWSVHYLPTTDGGAHLANADIVRRFVTGTEGNFANFYTLNPRPVPNWLGHFVLAVLLAAFRPATAEKIFMSAYLILLPLAVRYALRGVKRSAGWLAILAVPLELNWITHQGFYNFCGSVVIFFLALGYWLRRRNRMNLPRAAILSVLAFVLYAGHLSSILLFAATIAILATWFTAVRLYRGCRAKHYSLIRDAGPRMVITGLALLPAVALAVWFQRHGFEGRPPGLKLAILNKQYWKDLLQLTILVSFKARPEKWIARLTALLLWGVLAGVVIDKVRRRCLHRRDGLLLVPAALVGLYFLQGSKAHEALFIPQRLTFYATLTLLPFLAAQRYATWARAGVAVVAALLAVAFTGAHWKPFRQYDAQLAEYIDAGDRIPSHTTFLPLIFAPRGLKPQVADTLGFRATPFFSADGHIAIDRRAIDLRNYEAGLDHFPVRFRPAVDPFKHLAEPDAQGNNGLMAVPQVVNIAGYEASTHVPVEYVLLWGLPEKPESAFDANTRRTLDLLHAEYELVFMPADKRVQLWHRKPAAP
jgi:hypothetical protein